MDNNTIQVAVLGATAAVMSMGSIIIENRIINNYIPRVPRVNQEVAMEKYMTSILSKCDFNCTNQICKNYANKGTSNDIFTHTWAQCEVSGDWWKDCVGALDGTHIRAKVPFEMQGKNRGCKDETTQNVLATITFDLKFTFVLAGWEGSIKDSCILSHALSRPRGFEILQVSITLVMPVMIARFIIMPRKPTRPQQLLRSRPVTFSRFARSMALASVYKVKRRNSKTGRKVSPISSEIQFSKCFSGKEFENLPVDYKSKWPESSDEEEFEGVVQADFAFFDPKPNDFHGVKVLLKTYLDDKQWDLSGFVDLILGQTTVGTVIKIEEDEDDGVYAVATALNLGRSRQEAYISSTPNYLLNEFMTPHCRLEIVVIAKEYPIKLLLFTVEKDDHKCIMELKEFLLKVCQEERILHDMRSVLGEQAQDVGLLISQRVVNLPPQLLPLLYDALFDEVSWATEDEPTEDLRNSFCFKSYLFVSKIYKHKNADQKQAMMSNSTDKTRIYVKPEDEIFHKLSLWSFTFPLHTQQLAAHELKNYRLMGFVMAVEATKVSTFREELRCLIDE